MTKKHEGKLGDEGNVLYLDCGGSFRMIPICQNSQNNAVERVGFTVCT